MILVTVSDDRSGRKNGEYGKTQKKVEAIFRNNPSFGIKDFLMLTWNDIAESEFYQQNKILLDNIDAAKNGRAYKPWALRQGLDKIEEGDYLIYSDVSNEMWHFDAGYKIPSYYSLEVIKKLIRQNNGILSAFVKWDTRKINLGFNGIHTHENFTLDRCMRYMKLEQYSKCFMHASGMVAIQKQPHTVAFVDEWLHYNCIDECSALGKKEDPQDYSFWSEEGDKKIGARSDQSISGLLINKYGYKLCDIIHNNINPYCFLNFCREDIEYKFIDPNVIPYEPPRIRKGDRVKNKAGVELTVFEVWPEQEQEVYIVGQHSQSRWKTTLDQITPC